MRVCWSMCVALLLLVSGLQAQAPGELPPAEFPPQEFPPQDGPPDDVPPEDRPPEDLPPGNATREPGYLGLIADDRRENGRGVRVVEVVAEGPAAQGGLAVGDLVTAINRQAIRDMTDVARIIEASSAGTKLEFRIERSGQALAKQVVLGRRPGVDERRFNEFGQIPQDNPPATAEPQPPVGQQPVAPGALPAEGLKPWLGVRARPLTEDVAQALGVPVAGGAWVTEVIADSPAARAGITIDCVITRFGGTAVDGPATLGQLVAATDITTATPVEFYRRGQLQRVDMQLIEIARPAADSGFPPEALPPAGANEGTEQQRIAALERQVQDLEIRLARMEELLQKIAEQQGVRGDGRGPN